MSNVIFFILGIIVGIYVYDNPWILKSAGEYMTNVATTIER